MAFWKPKHLQKVNKGKVSFCKGYKEDLSLFQIQLWTEFIIKTLAGCLRFSQPGWRRQQKADGHLLTVCIFLEEELQERATAW